MPLPKWVETLTVVPEYLHVAITERESIPMKEKVPFDYSGLLPLLDELEVGEEILVDYDAMSSLVRRRMDNFISYWNKGHAPKKIGRKNTINGRLLIRIA